MKPVELTRVLYLEDDPSLSELAMMGLEYNPVFDVLHCASGKEAISKCAEFKPQLCLFDVMLPEMDGPTTFHKVRETMKAEDLPVIFMTAKAQRHEVAQYMALGALGVIRKPFNPLTIGDEVGEMWRNNNDKNK